MTNPLELPTGKQNRAAKKAGMTLAQWRDFQSGPQEQPEMYFQCAGPDAPAQPAAAPYVAEFDRAAD